MQSPGAVQEIDSRLPPPGGALVTAETGPAGNADIEIAATTVTAAARAKGTNACSRAVRENLRLEIVGA